MRIKIVGKRTGFGNQIQFIPFILALKKSHEVFSDSAVFEQLGVLGEARPDDWGDINIVLMGYSYKKFWAERRAGKGRFVGFKYRIKRRHIALGYHRALRFDESTSEVDNYRMLVNAVFDLGIAREEVDFRIPSVDRVKNRVVMGVSPKPEKTMPYQLWTEIIGRLRAKGYEVLIVDHDLGVEGYVKTPAIADLSRVIGSAQYYVGTDSGPMHLADILGVPSLIMFGSTDIIKNQPQLPESLVHTRKLPCSPCFDWGRVDCKIDYLCMKFSTDEIEQKFDELVARVAAKGTAGGAEGA